MEEELENLKQLYSSHLEERKRLGRKYNAIPAEIKTRVRELNSRGVRVKDIAQGVGASASAVDYWLHGDRYSKKHREKSNNEPRAAAKFRELKVAAPKSEPPPIVCGIVLQLKECGVEARGFSSFSEAAGFTNALSIKQAMRQQQS